MDMGPFEQFERKLLDGPFLSCAACDGKLTKEEETARIRLITDEEDRFANNTE